QNLWLYADQELCVRVLINLLADVVKHCRIGGQISIVVGLHPEDKSKAKISVSDTGRIAAANLLPRLFGSLSFDDDADLSDPSRGLSLYFCRLAVEAHGGAIGTFSRPGAGTVFFFDLPLAETVRSSRGDAVLQESTPEALSETDKFALRHHVRMLSELEVYETSNILALLDSITHNSEAVKAWKKEVRKAVFACNAVRYALLLRKVETD
ncbi:MAG: ATP-binding protein, partial [Bacteroidia bacterium]|nr:ATP-binding protein [Bacteroidia bacterium]MDW8333363.1 ATP-binding protein [Bacteroidia bacterium]